MAEDLPRLIVVAPSHFCEKARWALERYGVRFRLEPHAPGFHIAALRAAGRQQGSSTPCLVVPGPSPSPPLLLCDSADILRWADAQTPRLSLFPPEHAAEVEALCSRFDAGVGPAARSFVYAHALDSDAMCDALAPPCVPAAERFPWRWLGLHRVVRRLMRSGMRISPENGAAALETLRGEFAAVSALLADGRPYLAGGAFTAADLTFAALAAPALGVPYGEHPPWGERDTPPAPLREAADELRATPAGQAALRWWADERARVVVPSEVTGRDDS